MLLPQLSLISLMTSLASSSPLMLEMFKPRECMLTLDTGRQEDCRATPQWAYFFEYHTGRCHAFKFSGCGSGNGNRFSTLSACRSECTRDEGVDIEDDNGGNDRNNVDNANPICYWPEQEDPSRRCSSASQYSGYGWDPASGRCEVRVACNGDAVFAFASEDSCMLSCASLVDWEQFEEGDDGGNTKSSDVSKTAYDNTNSNTTTNNNSKNKVDINSNSSDNISTNNNRFRSDGDSNNSFDGSTIDQDVDNSSLNTDSHIGERYNGNHNTDNSTTDNQSHGSSSNSNASNSSATDNSLPSTELIQSSNSTQTTSSSTQLASSNSTTPTSIHHNEPTNNTTTEPTSPHKGIPASPISYISSSVSPTANNSAQPISIESKSINESERGEARASTIEFGSVTSPVTTTTITTTTAICSMPAVSPGEDVCKGSIPRFAFDVTAKACVSFTYGGCGATSNNFADLETCRRTCG